MVMARYRPPGLPPRNPLTATLRALWGVFCLFVGAADALISALLGVTPLAGPWAELRGVIADRWRLSYHDARDVDVIEEESEVGDDDA